MQEGCSQLLSDLDAARKTSLVTVALRRHKYKIFWRRWQELVVYVLNVVYLCSLIIVYSRVSKMYHVDY